MSVHTTDFPLVTTGETPVNVVVTAAVDPSPTDTVTRRLPIASLPAPSELINSAVIIGGTGLRLYCADDSTWYFLTVTLDQGVPTLTLTPDLPS